MPPPLRPSRGRAPWPRLDLVRGRLTPWARPRRLFFRRRLHQSAQRRQAPPPDNQSLGCRGRARHNMRRTWYGDSLGCSACAVAPESSPVTPTALSFFFCFSSSRFLCCSSHLCPVSSLRPYDASASLHAAPCPLARRAPTIPTASLARTLVPFFPPYGTFASFPFLPRSIRIYLCFFSHRRYEICYLYWSLNYVP